MPSGWQVPFLNKQVTNLLGTPGPQALGRGPGANYAPLPFGGAPTSTPGTYTGSIPPQPWQSSYSYPSSSVPIGQMQHSGSSELGDVLRFLKRPTS